MESFLDSNKSFDQALQSLALESGSPVEGLTVDQFQQVSGQIDAAMSEFNVQYNNEANAALEAAARTFFTS